MHPFYDIVHSSCPNWVYEPSDHLHMSLSKLPIVALKTSCKAAKIPIQHNIKKDEIISKIISHFDDLCHKTASVFSQIQPDDGSLLKHTDVLHALSKTHHPRELHGFKILTPLGIVSGMFKNIYGEDVFAMLTKPSIQKLMLLSSSSPQTLDEDPVSIGVIQRRFSAFDTSIITQICLLFCSQAPKTKLARYELIIDSFKDLYHIFTCMTEHEWMRVFLSLCPDKYSTDLDQPSMVKLYLDHLFQLPLSSATVLCKTYQVFAIL
jgi:hypothetical protein